MACSTPHPSHGPSAGQPGELGTIAKSGGHERGVFPATDGPVPEIDPTKPHAARIYDYGLGGKNHFAAGRAIAAQVVKTMPMAARAWSWSRTGARPRTARC